MIREQLKKDLAKPLEKLRISPEKLFLEHPTNPEHGDYSTNIAFQVKKKGFNTPQDLANHLVNTWRSLGLPEYIGKIEVAKPGFINLWLKNEVLSAEIERVLKEKDKYGSAEIGKGKTMVIDYSSPNIAKPFGFSHLRSTIIGQAIYNIYKFLGWETIGDNHLGDWGTQFGQLIAAIKKWNRKPINRLTLKDLVRLYVKYNQEEKKNEKLREEARAWFKKLEDGDREAKRIWRYCVEVSLKEFDRIYELLGVKIDYAYGESFFQDKMKPVIEEAKRKKIASESEGALVVKTEELEAPLILLKSDGATTYETRDLACVKYRRRKWKPNLYIYETAFDQALHFKQVFVVSEMLGYGKGEDFVHVGHGLIRLPSGEKMSTRAGKVVQLEDVLQEAIRRAMKIIEASETDRGLRKKEQEEVARAVGVGAVKYFDLMHHYSTDIIFDWEKMFVLEGNSAPYLQYTYARCQSVLGKAEEQKIKEEKPASQFEPEEVTLLRTIYKFPEVIQEAGENFAPNLICNFLFDLAQKYNLFYNKHPILKAETPELVEVRLALTTAVGQVLKNGLNLLGIEALERM